MAEYSKEKLYFLKLPNNFHKSHELNIIRNKPHGNEMAFFLIQLMCEATPWQGYLRYSPEIPYDNEDLASITNTDIEIVNSAMKLFKKYKIVEITKDKSIYIPMVEEMTISKTKGAEQREQQRMSRKSMVGRQKGDKRATKCTQVGDICRQDNKILDNKIIDIKNFVSNDTRSNNIEKKLLVNNKKKDTDFSDDEIDFINYAVSLHKIKEPITLEFFKGDERLFNEFLKVINEGE